jgi:hypothetical protein
MNMGNQPSAIRKIVVGRSSLAEKQSLSGARANGEVKKHKLSPTRLPSIIQT